MLRTRYGTTLALLSIGILTLAFSISPSRALPLVGDINGDGKVDIDDLVLLIKAFGSYPDHPRWNPNADLDNNDKVDIRDLILLVQHFGEHSP